MNLKWYDRALIALGGLVLLAVGILLMLMGGGVTGPKSLALDYWLGDGWQWMPILALVGLLLMGWGGYLLVRPFLSKGGDKGKYYTLSDPEAGEVHISVQALDHLVHRALSAFPEILSAQVRIGGQENAMHITLKASVQSNVRIPGLIADMRAQIKGYVEECAGVKVEEVKVLIASTKDVGHEEGPLLLERGKGRTLPETIPIHREPESFIKPEEIFGTKSDGDILHPPVVDKPSSPQADSLPTQADKEPEEGDTPHGGESAPEGDSVPEGENPLFQEAFSIEEAAKAAAWDQAPIGDDEGEPLKPTEEETDDA